MNSSCRRETRAGKIDPARREVADGGGIDAGEDRGMRPDGIELGAGLRRDEDWTGMAEAA